MLPTRLKVKVLVEATFAPVPLDRDPVQIANLEVAVKVYAAQPVVVAGLITHLCVEIDEAVETELNATVVKGTGSSISRIAAPTALTCVGEIGSGRGLRARLTMSEVPRIAEPAPTWSWFTAAKVACLNLNSPAAITAAQIDAAVPLGDTSLPDDYQPGEALTALMMMSESFGGFNL
jgi:hypothetical protein